MQHAQVSDSSKHHDDFQQANSIDQGQVNEANKKRASRAALVSLLNLTFLPGIGFLWLLFIAKECEKDAIDGYHARLGIKINLIAAFALLVVTTLIMLSGGLQSPYTWIYVINYFTLLHTLFIVAATWALARAWSGQKLRG